MINTVKPYNLHILESELHILIDSINEANFWEWISKAKKLLSRIKSKNEAEFLLVSLFQKLRTSSRITKEVILKHLIPIIITIAIVTPNLVQNAANLSNDRELVKITDQILHGRAAKHDIYPDFEQYKQDANAYLKFFPGTPLSGELMARAAKRTFDKTGILVPVDLALAQGQAESSLGTDPNHRNPKTNPWSVGEDDDRTTQHFKGIEHGTQAYYNLTAKNYLKGKTVDQLLRNFVDVNGERYATDKQYERKMKKRIDHIRDFLNRFHKAQEEKTMIAAR